MDNLDKMVFSIVVILGLFVISIAGLGFYQIYSQNERARMIYERNSSCN